MSGHKMHTPSPIMIYFNIREGLSEQRCFTLDLVHMNLIMHCDVLIFFFFNCVPELLGLLKLNTSVAVLIFFYH